MPNAGLSQRLEGRFVYAASAEYFEAVTPRLLDAGATDRRRLLWDDAGAHRGDADGARRGRLRPGDRGRPGQ